MDEFVVYYWFARGEKGHAVCQKMNAASVEEVAVRVQENLAKPSFAFESETEGHMVLQTANILYCEIENCC